MPLTMSLFKTVLHNHFHTILKPQKPLYGSQIIESYISHKCRALSSLCYSTTTSSPHIEDRIEPEEDNEKEEKKKPLDVMFTEAVGLRLCENKETSEGATDGENNELKSSLRELETEVRTLKATSSAKESVQRTKSKKSTGKSLYATFTNQTGHNKGRVERTLDEPQVYKELSPDMEVFVNHLCNEGYFNDANFLLGSKLEFGCFENYYGRNYIKFAAEKFSKDNQEIANSKMLIQKLCSASFWEKFVD
ncbi:hypothetical protein CJ030_MR4G004606 [Morella rubra]|uniref:Uncharacterized protein n=1 Tax=Morella rubra TaxID=262757 RepID=A0A6A1VWG6_9ROSI|nr:hypothetical protein CJ030_MR4G004606 [Morella rubra]